MIKILLAGSPCTYWSIAQKNNRETEPRGMGWEMFKNYLIAKEKFKPDFFLYENNKSAAEAIKSKIREELKVWDGTLFMSDSGARYIEINSALVSAQNRSYKRAVLVWANGRWLERGSTRCVPVEK